MDEDEINYLRELRQVHRNRLRVLELKAAEYGINCPPEVQTEINEIKKKVEKLDQQIRDPNKSPRQLIIPKDRAPDFKKLSVPSAIALFGFIVVIFVSVLANRGLAGLPPNPTSVASSTVSTEDMSLKTPPIASTAALSPVLTGDVLTPKPMSRSIASVTPQEGGVSQVKADSLVFSKYPGAPYLPKFRPN